MSADHDELMEVLGADFDDVDLAHFDGGEPPPCEPPQDNDQANRYLATLRYLNLQLAEVETIAQAEVQRVADWHEKQAGTLKRRYEWVERALNNWALAINEDDPNRRTLSFPNGEVKVRPRQPRLDVDTDEEVLRRLAKVRPGWVREKPQADKNAIKSAVKAGDPLEDQSLAPEGYRAHWAELEEKNPETGEVERLTVAGVVLLVPTGKAVTVTLAGGDQ